MTRFRCLAGHETELSFEANQLIYNGEMPLISGDTREIALIGVIRCRCCHTRVCMRCVVCVKY